MEKDFVQKEIEKILKALQEEGELLYDGEIEKISHLVSSLVKCELGTRLLFYEEINGISNIIERRLKQQKEEILEQLLGKTKIETWH